MPTLHSSIFLSGDEDTYNDVIVEVAEKKKRKLEEEGFRGAVTIVDSWKWGFLGRYYSWWTAADSSVECDEIAVHTSSIMQEETLRLG